MAKKRKAPPTPKVQTEEEKPKVVVKQETIQEEEEEEESESQEEIEEEEDDDDEEEESEESDSESEEEDDESSKRDTLRKLLEPFEKDQIIEFLKEAALKDPSILAGISQSAESDPAHRNIFIYGLGWDATSDQVLAAFKDYGDIEQCKVVTDKLTGRSKGYAFVLFKSRAAAQKALKQPQKKIGSRTASCQLASAGSVPNNPLPDPTGRKVFVANVGPHVNPQMLRLFFAKFGEIEEGPFGLDPTTGKFKGFAIFLYKTLEGCNKALEEPMKVFEGCNLQCRRAVEGPRTNKNLTAVVSASSSVGGAAVAMQHSGINALNYGVGVSPGIYGSNVNPAAVLMGQNPGIGFANPMLFSALNQTGLSPSVPTGLTPSVGSTQGLGISGNYGGINTVSPSVIGSYGSQAALQGLGAYQSAQFGNSSVGATSAVAARSQSGFGSVGTTFPSYFGR